jgi:hypothetical protein
MVCGAPVTVLHVGAGIFGGGKGGFSRGREANLWEVPNIETMLASKANASERLYADVADFGDVSHSDPSREGQFPWKTARFQPYNPGAWFLKIYACKHPDGRLAANFMKVQQDVFLEPFQGQQELTIYPCVGPGSDTVRITAGGEPFRVTRRGGFYIVGRQV